MNHIPSVRESDDWIPTNNWTDTSSSSSENSDENDPTPMTVATIHPPDRRPWGMNTAVVTANDDTATSKVAVPSPRLTQKESVHLTEYTFYDFIKHHEHVLVTFHFPCQRYLTKFVPLWTNLTNALVAEDLPVVTATVDCESHPIICHEQDCYRFPTIRWFYKGMVLVQDYKTGRNARKLFRFVKNTLAEIEGHNAMDKTHTMHTEPVRVPKHRKADVQQDFE
jgi:hypothetical protein